MLVAPLAGRAMMPVGSDRLAATGFLVAASGAVWTGLAAPSQDYAAVLPGILAFGVGLAMSTAAITATAIHEVPAARLGVASALPNISRYTGGALGAAILGAILNAHLPASLEQALGRVAPGGPRAGRRGLPHRPAGRRRLPGAGRLRRVAHAPPGRARAGARRAAPARRAGAPVRVLGVFLAPVRETPDHIALAEELGFASVWCYDSPLLYQDPFVALARAAERTAPHRARHRRAGAGPARAGGDRRRRCATLTALAPGRVRVAVGAGFTGRFTLGLGPVRLAALEREVADLRGAGWPARSAPTSRAAGRCATCPCRAPRARGRCRSTSPAAARAPRPWRAGSATAR